MTNRKPKKKVSSMLLPNIFSAQRTSLRPSTMLIRDEAPTPTSEPSAWMMFMIGIVMASPAMARAPTYWPRNTRSTMLYIDATTCVITAGSA